MRLANPPNKLAEEHQNRPFKLKSKFEYMLTCKYLCKEHDASCPFEFLVVLHQKGMTF